MTISSLIRPQPLRRGDHILAIAPAGGFKAEDAMMGARLLEERFGLTVTFVQSAHESYSVYAGPRARRAEALSASFTDTLAQGIWTTRGGSGTAQVIHALPPKLGQARWVIGFSDVTTLHVAVQARGLMSMHGPNLVNVATWSQEAQDELWAWLQGQRSDAVFDGHGLISGKGEGVLVGGNLTVLASLAGTQALPSFKDHVVLLEDIGESPYRLDRVLNQLIMSGFFAHARAIVLGQFTRCGAADELGPLTLLKESLLPLGLPVLAGVPIGHGPTSRAVPLGAVAAVDADQGSLKVQVCP